MAKRPRDYRAEYQRRIQLAARRAKALGRPISRSQARGHARKAKGELSIDLLKRNRLIRQEREVTERRYQRALRGVLAGASATAAARKVGMSPATFKRIALARGALSPIEQAPRPGLRGFKLSTSAFTIITSGGRRYDAVLLDRQNASTMGHYWNAVGQALHQGSTDPLTPFKSKTVTDLSGRQYRLMTSLKWFQAMQADMTDVEMEEFIDNIYRKLSHAA